MGSFGRNRNIRIAIAVVFSLWVICLAAVVLAGVLITRRSIAQDSSASPGSSGAETRIEISPSEGYAGTQITVSGKNWRPGEVVFIRLQGASGATDENYAYAGAVADEEGDFSTTFSYPYESRWLEGDTVQIVARAEASGIQASERFRLVKPTEVPTPTQEATATPTPTEVVPTTTGAESGQAPAPVLPTATPTPLPPPVPPITDWKGVYYTNPDLRGQPTLIRNDQNINFEWGTGGPAPGFPTDNFSVQWTRSLNFEGGNYRFYVRVDDGARLWIDNQLVIDQWHDSGPVTYAADLYLAPGAHSIRLDYFERVGWSVCQLWWERLITTYTDWKGEYFNNPNLEGGPVMVRNDPWIDFYWGVGSPAPSVQPDNFSVRWTRTLGFGAGDYRFYVRVDDGARLWLDGQLVVDQWHDSGPVTYAVDRYLSSGDHSLRLEYYDRGGGAEVHLWWERIETSFPDWKGEYFNNRDLQGSPAVVRNDPDVDFNWGRGSPAAGVNSDDFSVRWTRTVRFGESGRYRFYARVDDGVRVWVDGDRIIDEWKEGGSRVVSGVREVGKGNRDLWVEYFERTGDARITVWWEREAATATPSNTPTKAPTVTVTTTPVPTDTPTVPPQTTEHSISLSPSEGGVGTSIVVRGTGWPAGGTVSLTLAKPQPGATSLEIQPQADAMRIVVGADGGFETSLVVPAGQGWESESEVLVVAYTADYTKTAVARFAIVPGQVQPTDTPTATEEPTPGPPAEAPTDTPTATIEAPAEEPTATAEPSQEPTNTPEAPVEEPTETAEPEEQEEPTGEAVEEPVEETQPTDTPAPTESPTETPVPQAPVISVVPISGTIGITVTVYGQGWPIDNPVGFALAQPVSEGPPEVLMPLPDTVEVTAQGLFTKPLWLPAVPGWETLNSVWVFAQTADQQYQAMKPYTITVAAAPPVEEPVPQE